MPCIEEWMSNPLLLIDQKMGENHRSLCICAIVLSYYRGPARGGMCYMFGCISHLDVEDECIIKEVKEYISERIRQKSLNRVR